MLRTILNQINERIDQLESRMGEPAHSGNEEEVKKKIDQVGMLYNQMMDRLVQLEVMLRDCDIRISTLDKLLSGELEGIKRRRAYKLKTSENL